MIRGVHHAAVHSSNLERLVAFYRDVIGFEEVARYGWKNSELADEVIGLKGSAARAAMLRAGNCYLEIFEFSQPDVSPGGPLRPCDRGYTHICLDVTDIHKEYERLTRAGMQFNAPPGDFGDLLAAYGFDPDGNIVEIQETRAGQRFALSRLRMLRLDGE